MEELHFSFLILCANKVGRRTQIVLEETPYVVVASTLVRLQRPGRLAHLALSMATSDGQICDFVVVQRALIATTRLASSIPESAELKFQRTLSRPVGKKVDAVSKRLFHLTARVLELAKQGQDGIIKHSKGKDREIGLQEEDILDGFYKNVVEYTDQLLEKIDTSLDEHKRASSKNNTISAPDIEVAGSRNGHAQSSASGGTFCSRLPRDLLHSERLDKPQLLFADSPQNSRSAKFVRLIQEKPHALVPLDSTAIPFIEPGTGREKWHVPNPYEKEILAALELPLPEVQEGEDLSSDAESTASSSHRMRSRMQDKPFAYIDTVELLEKCLQKLRKSNIIAVDLEHHDYRSFRGFACLMQVNFDTELPDIEIDHTSQLSTPQDDFIIDLLVPGIRTSLYLLNEVFATPQIVKLLHGSDMDIIWLQRDFGIYVVNLFDTYQASRVLNRKTGHSLASLLLEHTLYLPDKRYQMADWRIRPLPAEMMEYARSDTHFLIHIYQRLLHDDSGMTPTALQDIRKRSAVTAAQVYEHAEYDFMQGEGIIGWRRLVEKAGKERLWAIDAAFSNIPSRIDAKGLGSFEVFRAAHEWRDRVARANDESLRYVLSNKALFAIAELPPENISDLTKVLGREVNGIVRSAIHELLTAITAAKLKAKEKIETLRSRQDTETRGSDVKIWDASATDGLMANSEMSSLTSATPSFSTATQNMAAAASALFTEGMSLRVELKSDFRPVLAKVHSGLFGQMGTSSVSIAMRAPSSVALQASTSSGSASSAEVSNAALNVEPVIGKRETSGTTPKIKDDDQIVQVSAGRVKVKHGKKRKMGKKDEAGRAGSEKDGWKSAMPVEPFDYAAVKSVLDTPDEVSQVRFGGKKQKKEADKDSPSGGFRRAPKSMSQPKSGNRSQTFL
ncbi:MAG: exosome nuclease subunit [Cyphobasidiales sp. Tagirdzhanova-0007]|nr:MAG: exosome nuclease subunit [Cyphobasidiales sp. Tagirdzhanova-0007]